MQTISRTHGRTLCTNPMILTAMAQPSPSVPSGTIAGLAGVPYKTVILQS